jgi:hypothetical protein
MRRSQRPSGQIIYGSSLENMQPIASEQNGIGNQASNDGLVFSCSMPLLTDHRGPLAQCRSGSMGAKRQNLMLVGGAFTFLLGLRPTVGRRRAEIVLDHLFLSGAWHESRSGIPWDRSHTRSYERSSNGPRVHQSIRHTVKKGINE